MSEYTSTRNPNVRQPRDKLSTNLLGLAAIAAAGAGVFYAGKGAIIQLGRDHKHDLIERTKNTSGYKVPSEAQAHRLIIGGQEYKFNNNGKTVTIEFNGIDSAADLIAASTDGQVSAETAKDFLMAENAAQQLQDGVAAADVQPLQVQLGQGFILPAEFRAGKFVPAAKPEG